MLFSLVKPYLQYQKGYQQSYLTSLRVAEEAETSHQPLGWEEEISRLKLDRLILRSDNDYQNMIGTSIFYL